MRLSYKKNGELKMYRNISLIVVLLLIHGFVPVFAQRDEPATIKGVVVDGKGKPIFGANIYIKGRYEGAMSDESGKFTFETSFEGKCVLIVSFVGYEKFEKLIDVTKGEIISLKIILHEEAIKLKKVVVTASSFTTGTENGMTLTPLEVVTTPGAAADICWAIKTYPGVGQVEEGAGLFVRGGEVTETKFILDGAEVTHPYRYESPTGGFFGTFTPFLLKGTYFSTGGFSAEYGDALSGILAMESLDMPTTPSINVGIGLAAFSTMIRLPIIKDKFGLSLSGNKSNTKYLFKLNRAKQKFTHYPSSYDVNLNLVYKFSRTGQLKLFLFKESDEIGVEVRNPTYSSIYAGDANNGLYNMEVKELIGEKWIIKSNLGINQFNARRKLNVLDINQADRLFQFKLSCEYMLNNTMTFRVGTQNFLNHVIFKGRVPVDENNLSPDAPHNEIDTDYHSYRSALFLETTFNIADKTFLTNGIRADYETFSDKMVFDQRFSIAYRISEQSSFKSAFGTFHQYPAPYYYDKTVGNPKLGPMCARHYIIGYELTNENTLCRLEGYYKDYDNLILNDSLLNYTNDGHGYAKGVDIFLRKGFKKLNCRLSYSYLIARRYAGEFTKLTPPDFDITHNLTMVLDYQITMPFRVSTSYRYATGKPYTPAPGEYNSSRVPDYHKLDVSLSYLQSFYEGNLTVFYVGISNITGRINIFDYLYSPDWSEREPVKSSFGRSIYFGVSVNI